MLPMIVYVISIFIRIWYAYIAVLYNNKYSTEEIYSEEKLIPELQLWNWKGELKKRICFDFPFDIYAISEDDILYAVNSGRPDYIYTYDLKWNLSVSRHAPTHTDHSPTRTHV